MVSINGVRFGLVDAYKTPDGLHLVEGMITLDFNAVGEVWDGLFQHRFYNPDDKQRVMERARAYFEAHPHPTGETSLTLFFHELFKLYTWYDQFCHLKNELNTFRGKPGFIPGVVVMSFDDNKEPRKFRCFAFEDQLTSILEHEKPVSYRVYREEADFRINEPQIDKEAIG